MPAMTAAYSVLRPDQVTHATPQLTTLQRVGGSMGTAILTVILQTHLETAGTSQPGDGRRLRHHLHLGDGHHRGGAAADPDPGPDRAPCPPAAGRARAARAERTPASSPGVGMSVAAPDRRTEALAAVREEFGGLIGRRAPPPRPRPAPQDRRRPHHRPGPRPLRPRRPARRRRRGRSPRPRGSARPASPRCSTTSSATASSPASAATPTAAASSSPSPTTAARVLKKRRRLWLKRWDTRHRRRPRARPRGRRRGHPPHRRPARRALVPPGGAPIRRGPRGRAWMRLPRERFRAAAVLGAASGAAASPDRRRWP